MQQAAAHGVADFDQSRMPSLPSMANLGQKSESDLQQRRRSENKDYSKHWLIQEAEQRRINEAKQKQKNCVDKMENINNNMVPGVNVNLNQAQQEPRDKAGGHVSENIYANIDATHINYSRNSNSGVPGPAVGPSVPMPPPPVVPPARLSGAVAGAPGPSVPQVPPRLGEGHQGVAGTAGGGH